MFAILQNTESQASERTDKGYALNLVAALFIVIEYFLVAAHLYARRLSSASMNLDGHLIVFALVHLHHILISFDAK